ncbi:MAG TPA: hypothetical protein PK636_06930 [bacterium]|nr:hypothetical protein [bacterium]HPJ72400.1 hypothetical protein [bacterium]HPQ65871.1 hypothetical protein [bacterium]
MKRLGSGALLLLLMSAVGTVRAEPAAPEDGYRLLREATAAEAAGRADQAAALNRQALDVFRALAGASVPETDPELDSSRLRIEEDLPSKPTDLELKLLRQQELILNQQQLILQKLAQVAESNAAFTEEIKGVRADTSEIPNLSDEIDDIRSNSETILDFEGLLARIEDNTQDIPEMLNTVDEIDNNTSDIGNIDDSLQDIRDNRDLLDQVISIVEDIKNDTDRIGDVESAVEDVKDEISSGGN